jgi:hypothetical protein
VVTFRALGNVHEAVRRLAEETCDVHWSADRRGSCRVWLEATSFALPGVWEVCLNLSQAKCTRAKINESSPCLQF